LIACWRPGRAVGLPAMGYRPECTGYARPSLIMMTKTNGSRAIEERRGIEPNGIYITGGSPKACVNCFSVLY
jgi:hypothetical protein